jgi:Zn-dependent protease with chaperone function
MSLTYLSRLACLSLACFFLLHLALALGVNLLAPRVLALASRRRPCSAAGLVLAARLFPSVAALLVVACVCVPSYFWLEPQATVEQVGLACLAAVLLSVVSLGASIWRGLRAITSSIRYERHCRQLGCETRLVGETRVLVTKGPPGLVALAGILRPRLLISRQALQNLPALELEAALRHESAHRISRDNLKRLLLLLTPDGFPLSARFFSGLGALENGWRRFSECAADDQAVQGDSSRSVALAGALVRVARWGIPADAPPLMTSLAADGTDLEARVDRLLGAPPGGEQPARTKPKFAAAMILLAGSLLAISTGPAALQAAHGLLEHLIR